MDEFKKELKKLKVADFKGGDITPWEKQGKNEGLLVQWRRCRCGGCGGCGGCGCGGCSCGCSCFFCSCFLPCGSCF